MSALRIWFKGNRLANTLPEPRDFAKPDRRRELMEEVNLLAAELHEGAVVIFSSRGGELIVPPNNRDYQQLRSFLSAVLSAVRGVRAGLEPASTLGTVMRESPTMLPDRFLSDLTNPLPVTELH